MIRALVIDDEPLARARILDLLRSQPQIRVVGECEDGSAAVSDIIGQRPDLIFLDVQMPELDGFDVLAAATPEHLPAVIFVTAYDEFALRAFDVHAIDYLLKPLNTERFNLAVDRAMAAIGNSGARVAPLLDAVARDRPDRLIARSGTRWLRLAADEVEWVKSAGNYLRLGTERGECLLREPLSRFLDRFARDRFVQVHRSMAVRPERIDALRNRGNGSYEIHMRSGFVCQSSRSYAGVLRRLLRG